jgi:predicted alpha-1,2-mannosidase
MKKYLLICTIFIQMLIGKGVKPVDYVDPMIGTGDSRWMLYPGPSMPFGMVKLSPDNQKAGWKAGYEYEIENIMGFSHIHSWTMGGLLFMPTTGDLIIVPGGENSPDSGYRSRFDHDNEKAEVGYYSAYLDDYNVKAELTSTTRAGFHRYTFDENDKARILIDLKFPTEYNFKVLDAKIEKVSDTKIHGYTLQQATYGADYNKYKLNFVIRFDKIIAELDFWKNGDIIKNKASLEGKDDLGIIANFDLNRGEIVQAQCGISFVSIEQAKINLEKELDRFDWDFDAVKRFNKQTWNDLLSKIEVSGGREKDKVKFYTNLYRSYCSRTIMSDVNGKYTDMYERTRQLDDPDSPVYGCDAFWNSFWNLNILWNLITPEITNKWVNSLLEIYDRGGWLPKGPAGIEYSAIMVGSHEIPFIVAAYQNGIREYDIEKAYEAIKEIQMKQGRDHPAGGRVGNKHLNSYLELGFVPADTGPVSNTLDYCYDDFCVAQMAKVLGETEDHDYFLQRARNYQNVFNPNVMYPWIRKRDGEFKSNFGIYNGMQTDFWDGEGFVEGNAWQYNWYVPHDVQGMINQMGDELFVERLNKGFIDSEANNFSAPHDDFEKVKINHGNQPNMQAAYLFNYTSKPWLTQKWVRKILDKYYGTGPYSGYLGDEDQGQMAAWYVISSIGLFQMNGGTMKNPFYEFGSPIFDRVEIELDEEYYPNDKLVLETKNNSPENFYINSIKVDGEEYSKYWIDREKLINTEKIVFEMSAKPNRKLDQVPPPSMTTKRRTSYPYISSDIIQFIDEIKIEMNCGTKQSDIHYTVDGSRPNKNSKKYTRPFRIDKTTTFKMVAYNDKFGKSKINTHTVEKKPLLPALENVDNLENGVHYKSYSYKGIVLPDYSKLTPLDKGITDYWNIKKLKPSEHHFAFLYNGYIKLKQDGVYTFYTNSDDGSKLFIDGQLVVDNDGSHGPVKKLGRIALEKGIHKFELQFYDDTNDELLEVFVKGPDGNKRKLIDKDLYIIK